MTKPWIFLVVFVFLLRMPVATRSIRDRTALGRFPSVTLGFREEDTVDKEDKEKPEGNDIKTENACKRWLRVVCPCCCPQPNDDDVTDTVVTETDEPDKDDGTDGEKPVISDGKLDGD